MSRKALTCRKCGAELIRVKTIYGKSILCNAEETYYIQEQGGNDRIVTPNGIVLACTLLDAENDDLSEATGYGYVPHRRVCPASEKYRERANK